MSSLKLHHGSYHQFTETCVHELSEAAAVLTTVAELMGRAEYMKLPRQIRGLGSNLAAFFDHHDHLSYGEHLADDEYNRPRELAMGYLVEIFSCLAHHFGEENDLGFSVTGANERIMCFILSLLVISYYYLLFHQIFRCSCTPKLTSWKTPPAAIWSISLSIAFDCQGLWVLRVTNCHLSKTDE